MIAKSADKELNKSPLEIKESFEAWKNLIEIDGPKALLRVNGLRDHSLRGEWEGARSSSLSKQWRVIYFIKEQEILVLVLKITPHDYRRGL